MQRRRYYWMTILQRMATLKTLEERPAAAARSTAMTARHLWSRARSRVPLMLQQLRCQVQKSGTSLKTSSPVIPLPTDGPDLEILLSPRLRKAPSPMLLLLLPPPLLLLPHLLYLRLLHHPLIPSSLRHPIHRPNQVMAPLKRSDLVLPMKEKRRQTQVTGTMEMEMDEIGTGRPRAPWALQVSEIPPSVRRTMQVRTREAKVCLGRRKSHVQVSPQVPSVYIPRLTMLERPYRRDR
jgi:hypothetical protein